MNFISRSQRHQYKIREYGSSIYIRKFDYSLEVFILLLLLFLLQRGPKHQPGLWVKGDLKLQETERASWIS